MRDRCIRRKRPQETETGILRKRVPRMTIESACRLGARSARGRSLARGVAPANTHK
jgi:hypothetical protein